MVRSAERTVCVAAFDEELEDEEELPRGGLGVAVGSDVGDEDEHMICDQANVSRNTSI